MQLVFSMRPHHPFRLHALGRLNPDRTLVTPGNFHSNMRFCHSRHAFIRTFAALTISGRMRGSTTPMAGFHSPLPEPLRTLLIGAFFILGALATAAPPESPEVLAAERTKVQAQFPAEFAPVTDDPALPRVLLIGDSISIGYTQPVRDLLRSAANVHRIPENGGPSSRGLQQLDRWLGTGNWAVIHFNFGLHDIKIDPEGRPLTTPEEYERNLRALVIRLQATGARLIFATTTPVPARLDGGPRRNSADVIERNDIARRIMKELHVPIDDLYTVAFARLGEVQRPFNVHFTDEGSRILGERVAAAIRSLLPSAPLR